jgi:hypothetical protein
MPLAGRWLSPGPLVLNCDATNERHTQYDKPILPLKITHFQTYKWPWKEQKFGPGVFSTKNNFSGFTAFGISSFPELPVSLSQSYFIPAFISQFPWISFFSLSLRFLLLIPSTILV